MNELPCRTIPDILENAARRHAHKPCLGFRSGETWRWMTYGNLAKRVEWLRRSLHAAGVRKGDRVAMIANNRWEWVVAAFATYSLGATFVPMYESQTPKAWAYIIADCAPKAVFAANAVIAMQLEDVGALRGVGLVALLDRDGTDFPTLASMLVDGSRKPPVDARPEPSDLACLIYTSGTTGNPKGVMLTHENVVSNIEGVRGLGLVNEADRSLAFLPWAHVFGHVPELLGMLRSGGSVAICGDAAQVLPSLAAIRPTVLFTVPRVLEKVEAATAAKVASAPRFVRWLYARALANAERPSLLGSVLHAVAWLLIFRKVSRMLGGRLRMAVCGGAALKPSTDLFMECVGVPALIGYGMTEASPIIAVNVPGDRKRGCVGRVLPGLDVSICTAVEGCEKGPDEGEIVVRGPNVMRGYWNLPEASEAAFMSDGALRTGDLGRFEGMHLRITGRLKDIDKLSNGKYVAPVPIEERICSLPFVKNALVYCNDRPYPVALLVVDDEFLGRADAATTALAEVQRATSDGCASYERPRKVALVSEDFTLDNGLLTPTLKVKRGAVAARHRETLERLYD